MRKLLFIAVALTSHIMFAQDNAAPPAAQPSAAPAFKAHVLDRAELDALLARPDKLLIIDVRRPDELAKIGGFPVYLSIQVQDLPNRLTWIPKDRTVITVSNHAVRAGRAADLLTSKGFRVAGAVGAQTYEEQGGQLTRVASPAAAGATANDAAPTARARPGH